MGSDIGNTLSPALANAPVFEDRIKATSVPDQVRPPRPFVKYRITGHSPPLMLLCMVSIAGLLIPLHRRMEHFITDMLVSKNNRVRLEAARKTIEELEARPEEGKAG